MKKLSHNKFNQFSSIAKHVFNTIDQMREFGIYIKGHDEIDFEWRQGYVGEKVAALSWRELLYLDEEIALSLACYQEQQNKGIYKEEINTINSFFDAKVTKQMIADMGTRFL